MRWRVACGEESEALAWGRGDLDLRAKQEPPWLYAPDRKNIWLTVPCHCPVMPMSASTAVLVCKAI